MILPDCDVLLSERGPGHVACLPLVLLTYKSLRIVAPGLGSCVLVPAWYTDGSLDEYDDRYQSEEEKKEEKNIVLVLPVCYTSGPACV